MTRTRAAALAMLATGASVDQVAAKLGKSTRTIRRWVKSPELAGALAEAHVESIERCGAMLAHVGPAMLAAIVRIAQDESAPASARLAACRDILDRLGVGVRPAGASGDDDDRLAPVMFGNLSPEQRSWIPQEQPDEPPEGSLN